MVGKGVNIGPPLPGLLQKSRLKGRIKYAE
jgi:hypothetical protein